MLLAKLKWNGKKDYSIELLMAFFIFLLKLSQRSMTQISGHILVSGMHKNKNNNKHCRPKVI